MALPIKGRPSRDAGNLAPTLASSPALRRSQATLAHGASDDQVSIPRPKEARDTEQMCGRSGQVAYQQALSFPVVKSTYLWRTPTRERRSLAVSAITHSASAPPDGVLLGSAARPISLTIAT